METRLVDLHETNEEPRERLRRGEETLEREVNREPPKKQTVPMVSRPSEKPTRDISGKERSKTEATPANGGAAGAVKG
ncbi:hypothetical protein F2Q68_00042617 [Brassica cretica]|uniref:Uncharacterized protein n=1 Tax=Brassica cretica TaxID=69181 RepID=A0A8S9MHA7_BRACR|nr:hypothetical protein F2Q68_00042617 [Brassica cretica]